ncbi:protein FAR1-RELATED SEQUENCE 5-like [Cornus florida]|uniref:protein FAR1-RELATED SEQUENCE 5-like n=1 Tax=Cornus florida TaxID=4283 RepID=UPI0028974EA8|nr:protein FAR1-RELATED SEQUENCE 5-like [Cornus florida]
MIDIEDTTNAVVIEPQVNQWKPRFKMEFDTEQEAYEFYNAYGGRVGFSIRREYFNNSRKTGKLLTRLFTYCKEGARKKDRRDKYTKTPRAETRTGCCARMHIKYDEAKGKYLVDNFVDSHNHPLIIDECTHMIPLQRCISSVQAIDVDLASDSGIAARNSYELMARQSGCKESLDAEQMITNKFWADPKMITDYGHFGDVVTFDTTYKLVHGNCPFALFLGVNQHREMAVFGAALMYDETADSFVWLFDTFLKAMSGKTPKTILIDQDAAMAKALMHVMPGTKHHLCTWHLMQNAQKHVGFLFKHDERIKNVISKLIFEIEEEEQFMSEWDSMLRIYDLVGNTWLEHLFSLTHRSAMAFVKYTWCAGMRIMQLSESFNTRLKEYLSRQLILPDFFTHFERLLSDKRYKEYEAEYRLLQRLPQVKSKCDMLLKAGETYTKVIFQLFQEEFLTACVSDNVNSYSDMDNNGQHVYKVTSRNGMQRSMT